MKSRVAVFCCALLGGLVSAPSAFAQQPPRASSPAYDTTLFQGLRFRMVGPYRGGRSTAVTGVRGEPYTYYMGSTGGGVWKTVDAGETWTNLSDAFFNVGSIGAIAVAESDPNVIYVGTGSACIRGNVSAGRGLYRSDDGGKTWTFSGLRDGGQIGRIVVHPQDPNLVYVAVLGHAFGKNPDRGVFRSKDGGKTWEKVLFVSDSTGAVDLSMNPRNPREIYAGMWRGERKPWTLISGATEGGVYQTTDGGDRWKKLGGGLPAGIVGKVGVAVSPATPDRVWALIEAEPEGGVYRSDDAGKTWQRVNAENKLRQRAWYYTHIFADPQNPNTVYALNTGFYRSVDGGKTFDPIQVLHGDMHAFWANPDSPNIMIVGDDGGGQVSLTGGKTWSSLDNQPTAELYGVAVDNQFPYRLYGAQQDNTTISVPSASSPNTIHPIQHWYRVGGCETGPVALHPDYPDTVYAGCYGGVIDRYDVRRDDRRNMVVYPELQLGQALRDLKYRFQWTAPIVVSPQDPKVIYHGAQYVLRSGDGGSTWERLSGDLTTQTPEQLGVPGGPLNHDNTGVEVYNTVFAIALSPQSPDVIWAGTDDGRLHLSKDNGKTWAEVTPKAMPKYGTVNAIEASSHQAGRVFVAVQKYRFDDFAPYIFRTNDYGQTWELLTTGTNGIPADYPVRVVREDPDRKGLLYAGTEFGLFLSFNDGKSWQRLQQNLPVSPVTDIRVHRKDLVLSTQGRSFWVLDDLTPLQQLTDDVPRADVHLFQPRDAYRAERGGDEEDGDPRSPEPAPNGATIYYYLAKEPGGPVTVDIVDARGTVARSFTSDTAASRSSGERAIPGGAGMYRITWDLLYRAPRKVPSAVIWGYQGGVKAPPGTYQVRLAAGGKIQSKPLRVLMDPRLDYVTQADLDEQFRLAIAIRDSIDQVYEAIRKSQSVSGQVAAAAKRAEEGGFGNVKPQADSVTAKLDSVLQKLMQTRSQSNQDPIRFAGQLDNQYIALYENVTGADEYRYGGAEGKPTPGAYDRFKDLNALWTDLRARLQRVFDHDVAAFNQILQRIGVPAVAVPQAPRLVP